ncbi:MAG: transglutaminase-like domain-containing protein, partial [Candidatus Eremiobacterota bacterium]
RDPVEKARILEGWVHRKLDKSYGKNASTARDVLKNRAGDCTEHALLFVALARSAGIPSREVGGLVYAGDPGLFAWHAWAEIHDGHQWVSVDPMWDQVYVDPTHIKMQKDSDDYSWVNVCGGLKLKVVKAQ